MKTEDRFWERAVLALAILSLVSSSARATVYGSAKLQSVGLSYFDATPDDGVGVEYQDSGVWVFNSSTHRISHLGPSSIVVDKSLSTAQFGLPVSSDLANEFASSKAEVNDWNVDISASVDAIADGILTFSSVSAFASPAWISIAPGTGVNFSAIFNGAGATTTKHTGIIKENSTFGYAFGIVRQTADGLDITQQEKTFQVYPTQIWGPDFTSVNLPAKWSTGDLNLKMTHENRSGEWEKLGFLSYAWVEVSSQIAKPHPVPEVFNTSVMGFALSALLLIRRFKSQAER